MKKEVLLIFCLVFLILPLLPDQVVDLKTMRGQPVTVTIQGAVEDPMTLSIPPASTLEEALAQVQLCADADLSPFSMSMILKDNDVIEIPHLQEVRRISINTSTAEQLSQLPGIGEATAQKIVDYRNEHGLFQRLEDLMQIPGIKEKKFNALKEQICL